MKRLFIITMAFQLITAVNGCKPGKASSAEITWRIATTLPAVDGAQLGVAGACAGVHNDVMLVAGGANFPDSMPWLGASKRYHEDVYAFIQNHAGTVEHMQPIFKLHKPLAYAASISAPHGIVCAGGENETGISNEVFLMQWDVKKKRVEISNLPALPVAVTNASITTDGEKVYVAGGEMPDGVSNQFFALELKDCSLGWKSLSPLPHPVSHSVLAFIPGQKQIYLVGGRKKNPQTTSTFYNEVYAYDVDENKWTPKTGMPYTLSAGTGIGTMKRLLMFGGDRGETFHRTELLIAEINSTVDSVEKEKLTQQKAMVQSTHPGFSREVLEYDLSRDEWKITDSIPFEVPVTTTAIRWKQDIIIPSGEIRAGVRTAAILAGRLTD